MKRDKRSRLEFFRSALAAIGCHLLHILCIGLGSTCLLRQFFSCAHLLIIVCVRRTVFAAVARFLGQYLTRYSRVPRQKYASSGVIFNPNQRSNQEKRVEKGRLRTTKTATHLAERQCSNVPAGVTLRCTLLNSLFAGVACTHTDCAVMRY